MYIPSLNEFSSLNYAQKIQVVENIQNIIEAQKKKYLRKNNNEILISSYYPKNKELNINNNNYNTENDLSSSLSSDDTETRNEKYIIEKAKKNIINFKKDFEQFKSEYYLYELNNEKNNIEKIKETIPDQEINYKIETTDYCNNSDNDSFNEDKDNINNINLYHKENFKNGMNYKKKIPINKYKINTNNKILIKSKKGKEEEKNQKQQIKLFKKDKKNSYYDNSTKTYRINSSYNILNSIPSKNNKKKIQTQSLRKYTKSYSNINNKYKLTNTNTNNVENIKKKLNFSKISNNKSHKSLLGTISNTQGKKINKNETSNRLYNMHKVIKEKLIRKKKEFEEEEIKNCSFMPKINIKSKKIVKNIIKRENKNQKEIYKKINAYNFFNKIKI